MNHFCRSSHINNFKLIALQPFINLQNLNQPNYKPCKQKKGEGPPSEIEIRNSRINITKKIKQNKQTSPKLKFHGYEYFIAGSLSRKILKIFLFVLLLDKHTQTAPLAYIVDPI